MRDSVIWRDFGGNTSIQECDKNNYYPSWSKLLTSEEYTVHVQYSRCFWFTKFSQIYILYLRNALIGALASLNNNTKTLESLIT